MYLKNLCISGFRGIGQNLDLPLDHRTIIYGPNGSGKSSVFQAIAWTIYGKLPRLTGGVFTREDALVNDFLDEGRAAITLTLSDDITIGRTRDKQRSTTRGRNPLTISFEADNPQAAVEQLIGLGLEEFFAAIFLHQETIRDFITTTPEKRSATIDRMLGTYLLRTLVKVVDPKVPAKAIGEVEEAIKRLDRQLSQASVISREVIQERKEEHGDPAGLPQLLENIRQALVPIAAKLGLLTPEATLVGLESGLAAARQAQLNTVSALENRAGQFNALKERYEQAAITSWQMIHQRREQYGDPADIPNLLGEIQRDLTPITKKLELPAPQATVIALEESLAAARQAQPTTIGELEKEVGQLGRLKERHEQATVTSWQTVHQRREQYGDPADLPNLLGEIQRDLTCITGKLEFPTPQATVIALEESLAAARQVQPTTIGELEKEVGQLGRLKERYEQAAVTSWQTVHQHREQYGDPSYLPTLLREVQRDLISITEELELATPQATIADLEQSLAAARQAVPSIIGQLAKKAGQLGTLKERYERVSEEVIEGTSIPPELENRQAQIQAQTNALNRETPALTRQLNRRQVLKRELAELQCQTRVLPQLRSDIEKMQRKLEALEAASKQGKLYNQILAIGQEHLEQARPEHCPLCKQQISDLQALLEILRRETPADVERIRQEYGALSETLTQKRNQTAQLERKQRQIQELEATLADFPEDLEAQIKSKREDSENLNNELATVQAEIAQIKGRIRLAAEHRRRLNIVLREVEEALGRPPSEDVIDALDQAIQTTRDRAADIQALDFQPIATKLDQANQLGQIEKDEAQLRQRLNAVLEEVEKALGQSPGEDVVGTIDQAIQAARDRVAGIQALDFQPIANKLDQAKQLSQIEKDEAQLRQRLDTVLEEIKGALGRPPGEDVAGALDQAIQATRDRATEIQALDFQPIATKLDLVKQLGQIEKDEAQLRQKLSVVLEEVKEALERAPGEDVAGALDQTIQAARDQAASIQALDFRLITKELNRAKQINEIRKDEIRLREFESSYQTATRQKARLNYQIQRLTDLRNALQDIAETTKRRQQAIVAGVLNDLDIHRYYQELDPHPAYRQLQIEPELTKRGTYNYWIKALTDDRSHGTYVQTRFSTAQANCAAIAIFLAVNQHLSKKLETIILDDPSQSMDPEHKMRLAQTLATIPHQVIVATEDAQTFEFLMDAFDTPTIHRLGSWTVDGTSLAG